jgi:fructose-bisphosphate aldolase, class I
VADTGAGVQRNLSRLFDLRDGRAICFALAHGRYGQAPRGVEDLGGVARRMTRLGVDGLTFNVGGYSRVHREVRGSTAPAVILVADAYFTSTMPGLVLREDREVRGEAFRIVASAEELSRAGADLVKVYLWFGMDDVTAFTESVAELTRMIRECNLLGLPVMVEPVPWGVRALRKPVDGQLLADVIRMSWELGADVLKVPAIRDARLFEDVVRSTPVPILATDSPDGTVSDLFDDAQLAVDCGAAGILFGSPTTGTHPKPWRTVSLLRAVIHEGLRAADAKGSLEEQAELEVEGAS